MLISMRSLSMRSLAFLSTFASALCLGCADDPSGPDGIIRFSTSFESGLDGFAADGTDLDDPPVEWEIGRSQERADDGAWSIRLELDNLNDAGKIWIERAFQLEAGGSYDVEVSYAFATADFGDINNWTIIAGVTPADPETVEDLTFQGDTGNGGDDDVGFVWLEKSHEFTATAGAGGELWLALGVWGTSEFPRAYHIDDVEVVFTPR